MAETKPYLEKFLIINSFGGKKVKNVEFYLKKFNTLTHQVKISDEL